MRMIVGATEVTVSGSIGAPAPSSSSTKIHWSIAERPRPPYSVGQAMPQKPLSRSLTMNSCASGPLPSLPASRCSSSSAGVMLLADERPDLVAPGDLLGREVVTHGDVVAGFRWGAQASADGPAGDGRAGPLMLRSALHADAASRILPRSRHQGLSQVLGGAFHRLSGLSRAPARAQLPRVDRARRAARPAGIRGRLRRREADRPPPLRAARRAPADPRAQRLPRDPRHGRRGARALRAGRVPLPARRRAAAADRPHLGRGAGAVSGRRAARASSTPRASDRSTPSRSPSRRASASAPSTGARADVRRARRCSPWARSRCSPSAAMPACPTPTRPAPASTPRAAPAAIASTRRAA